MRYSIVQGPRNSFFNAYSGIGRIFALRVLHGQPPVCYEDGQSLRDYVYVGDVARANVLCLADERADFRSFNVAGQRGTTVLEYAQLVTRIAGRAIEPLVSGEYRFGDTRHTRLLRRGPTSPRLAARGPTRTDHWRIHRVDQKAAQPRGLLRGGPSEYAGRQRPPQD